MSHLFPCAKHWNCVYSPVATAEHNLIFSDTVKMQNYFHLVTFSLCLISSVLVWIMPNWNMFWRWQGHAHHLPIWDKNNPIPICWYTAWFGGSLFFIYSPWGSAFEYFSPQNLYFTLYFTISQLFGSVSQSFWGSCDSQIDFGIFQKNHFLPILTLSAGVLSLATSK